MNYLEVTARLFSAAASKELKLSLEPPRELSELLNFPERAFPTIHIAGTNGKGSVATKIAIALQAAGLKTGLYTSPHLSCFRERIVIDGLFISEEEVCTGMDPVFAAAEILDGNPSFFEMTTALAFDYFRRKRVDVAVIETGLGGRLDATNIIEPLLSVITSINFDHMQFLGDTLEAIAGEKAGIIKPGVPVVIGPRADFQMIRERAEALRCRLIKAPDTFGFYDVENNAIARAALQELQAHFPLTPQVIEKGLSSRPACRFEKVGAAILDVAHNPAALVRLFEALAIHYPNQPFHLIFGMCRDKDVRACLKLAAEKAAHIHLVQARGSRAATTEYMSEILENLGYSRFSCGTIKEGLSLEQGLLVISGSFYIMAEARQCLGLSVPHDALDLNHLAVKV